jgi:hypothetical protein
MVMQITTSQALAGSMHIGIHVTGNIDAHRGAPL